METKPQRTTIFEEWCSAVELSANQKIHIFNLHEIAFPWNDYFCWGWPADKAANALIRCAVTQAQDAIAELQRGAG